MAEHLNKNAVNPFLRTFIPLRGDTTAALIRKIVVLACVVTVIVCGVVVISDYITSSADKAANAALAEMVDKNSEGNFSIGEQQLLQIKEESAITVVENDGEVVTKEILDKFVDLYAENSDLVGWLKVGHYISYPVMMNEDDTEYYLYRDFYGNDSKTGSIFCDNHVLPFTKANNLVIYGHDMASGEYFGKLLCYDPYASHGGGLNFNGDFIGYYQDYPTIQFDTLWEEGTYKIFAGIYINTEEKDGYPYPYFRKRLFHNELEFMDFMGNIMDRSMFYTGVDVEYGDQIITLSTCCYTVGKDVDARFALFARKVREGEDPSVDVSKIQINPDPLFFDTYYNRMGGSWGGRSWDLSLVKDFDKYSDQIDSLDENEP